MMTKKCYACIKTAQENAVKIKEITDKVLAPGGLTQAYNAIKEIAEMNNKFYRQFKDTSPEWTPPQYQNMTYQKYQQQARQQAQSAQHQQSAVQASVQTTPAQTAAFTANNTNATANTSPESGIQGIPAFAYETAYDESLRN